MECIVEKEKNELVIVNDGESISVYVDGIDYACIEKEEYVYAESLDENMTETRFLFDKYGNKVYSAVLESNKLCYFDTEIILDGNILMLDYFSAEKKLLVLIEERHDDDSKKRYINIYDKYRGMVKTVEEPYDMKFYSVSESDSTVYVKAFVYKYHGTEIIDMTEWRMKLDMEYYHLEKMNTILK